MAYPAISALISTQVAAVVKKVFIKTGSEKWQYLGQMQNGEIKITPYVTNNTMQQNLGIGSFTFEAKFDLLQTLLGELELIDSMLDGSNSFLFQLADAGAISSGVTAGWFTVSNTQIGVKATYTAGDGAAKQQFTNIMIKGTLKSSELDAAVKASIATADFHISTTASETFSNNAAGAGGTIFGYYIDDTANNSVGIKGNVKPAGFSSVALDDALSSGAVTLTRIANAKLVIDWLAEEDDLGRYNTYGVDINVEYEGLSTDAATMLLQGDINLVNTNIAITLLDGKVFTLNSTLGVQVHFEDLGDFDKLRKLRFIHKGRILKSDFDGVVA